jgi:hypothetical protein
MPVPIEFIRGCLGLLCIVFAHMAGRTAAAARRGRTKNTRTYGWVLRTVLCGGGLLVRNPLDALVLLIWGLAAASFAAGYWTVSNAKPPEDLSDQIVPHDPA